MDLLATVAASAPALSASSSSEYDRKPLPFSSVGFTPRHSHDSAEGGGAGGAGSDEAMGDETQGFRVALLTALLGAGYSSESTDEAMHGGGTAGALGAWLPPPAMGSLGAMEPGPGGAGAWPSAAPGTWLPPPPLSGTGAPEALTAAGGTGAPPSTSSPSRTRKRRASSMASTGGESSRASSVSRTMMGGGAGAGAEAAPRSRRPSTAVFNIMAAIAAARVSSGALLSAGRLQALMTHADWPRLLRHESICVMCAVRARLGRDPRGAGIFICKCVGVREGALLVSGGCARLASHEPLPTPTPQPLPRRRTRRVRGRQVQRRQLGRRAARRHGLDLRLLRRARHRDRSSHHRRGGARRAGGGRRRGRVVSLKRAGARPPLTPRSPTAPANRRAP